MPACSFPEANMAGVIGSEGLMDATSNAGVCPGSDPAAHNIAAPIDGNILFDTAVLPRCKSIVRYPGPRLQSSRGGSGRERLQLTHGQLGHWTQSGWGFSHKQWQTTAFDSP